jgi:hypothetical protein
MEGVKALLCYSPTLPLLRASCGRVFLPCVLLSKQQGRWELLRATKENMCPGELNPRPQLWYHARGPSSASPIIKVRWYERGDVASYVIVQHSPSYMRVAATRWVMCVLNKQQGRWDENSWPGEGGLNARPRLWYHDRWPSSASPIIKLRWYKRGEGASYAIVQYFPSYMQVAAMHSGHVRTQQTIR